MRISKISAVAAVAAATITTGVLAPADAAPVSGVPTMTVTQTPGTTARPAAGPGTCSGSWIYVDTLGGEIGARSRPDADAGSTIVFIVKGTGLLPCRKGVTSGLANACGVTGSHAWVLVQNVAKPGWSGYIPAVCTSDYS
ncbi:hypothetical protein SAMN05421837_11450 [Amycolatopsis pretoriensis]|uniref:Uncharacterized protein n=1 Tax=Amycolatopsis pretoriensis TaxID=218821 RepID=A0A1H5RGN6_9PSEU|nr:hypothetical protein [Amycolatopsis pretoriensis]SEF37490.1 hypothetical protein SAMN05421837_11450 [Amycolatopsis pretoriensis]